MSTVSTARERRELARQFANEIARISSSHEDWRAFYIDLKREIERCANRLRHERHKGRAGRLRQLAASLESLSLAIIPPRDAAK